MLHCYHPHHRRHRQRRHCHRSRQHNLHQITSVIFIVTLVINANIRIESQGCPQVFKAFPLLASHVLPWWRPFLLAIHLTSVTDDVDASISQSPQFNAAKRRSMILGCSPVHFDKTLRWVPPDPRPLKGMDSRWCHWARLMAPHKLGALTSC